MIYIGGDFIKDCIAIKLTNNSTEILVLNKSSVKIDILNIFNINIGLNQLTNINAKKEYISIINEKLSEYKNIKEIFFAAQNEDVIIREYHELPRIRKRDLDGYVNFEIVKDMPVNVDQYIVKYRVLNLEKSIMDLQVILFPKYIEKICSDIAKNLNIKRKYLNMNFDIVQKLIDRNKIYLKCNDCIIMENTKEILIMNLIKNKKIYTSNVIDKDENLDYVLSCIEKDMHIFYCGEEDNFINKIKENSFKVDKLEVSLKVNDLCTQKIVDKDINKYMINIGVVV